MPDTGDIYGESFVWDDHCGFTPGPGAGLDALLRPWREAGVGYLFVNVYFDPQPWTNAEEVIDRARAADQLAVIFDIEGMNALDGRIEMVQRYYDLGVRLQAQQPGGLRLPRRGHRLDRYRPPGHRGDEPCGRTLYYWPKDCGYESPTRCLDVRRLPDVTNELRNVGFDDAEIGAVLGGNFRRVAEQVWR
jgi:hypothetical protein